MMNAKMCLGMWDHLRQCNGIALRAVAAIPADKIHSHPIPNMRTPTELVVHTYGTIIRGLVDGVASGEITELDEAKVCAGIQTRDDLVKYARDCWNAADQAVRAYTDESLSAIVKSPWGMDMPGFVWLGTLHDEFLHHRGQLYVYLRQLGQEPPMIWDFANNAPEFQPREHAQA